MGLNKFEVIPASIPMYPINYSIANRCYVIIHNRNVDKQSHMSILVDLGGNSTDKNMIGELIHLIANTDDGQCPHSVSLDHMIWQGDMNEIQVVHIGNLLDSQYLNKEKTIPTYMIEQYLPSDIHCHISDVLVPIPIRRGSLLTLAGQVYSNMVQISEERWSSSMNCQQFSRRFITEGLGLRWPDTLNVCGESLSMCVDVGINLLSSSNNIKHR